MKTYISIPRQNEIFRDSSKSKKARLNVRAVAVTQTLIGAALFLVCSLLVFFFPKAAAQFIGFAFHTDLSGMARPISFVGFLVGLIIFSLGFGLVSALAAGVYNNLTKDAD